MNPLEQIQPCTNKNFVLLNNTDHTIIMGQLGSDYNNVNFIIESEDTIDRYSRDKSKYKELAVLYPGDTISLHFNPLEEITK